MRKGRLGTDLTDFEDGDEYDYDWGAIAIREKRETVRQGLDVLALEPRQSFSFFNRPRPRAYKLKNPPKYSLTSHKCLAWIPFN